MITILGAGGAIGNELVKLLSARKQSFRLVGRNPRNVVGATEAISADIADQEQTIRAVAGSSVVHLLVGLKYDHKLWAEMWLRIMSDSIESCKRAGAKLVFSDNVYMYGKVSGPMTEQTPFNPCSRKGEIRAKIANSIISEWKSGTLTAMIARAADFYGPDTRNGVPNILVFEPFSKNEKASWLVNDSVPHSCTYTVDAAQSLVTLAESEKMRLESDVARSDDSEPADWKRVHCHVRKGIRHCAEVPGLEPTDDPFSWFIQLKRGRVLRDALSE